MSQKSGFTSIGLWNVLHLLAKIPKAHWAIPSCSWQLVVIYTFRKC